MSQPRLKLKVANRMVCGWSYAEIADDLGISEYRVSKIVNNYSVDPQDSISPDDVAFKLNMSGIPDMLAHDDFGM